jgi:stage II sporulation protein AA (anti-sigma F factor antagonist)
MPETRHAVRVEPHAEAAVVVVLEGEHDLGTSAELEALLSSLLAEHELVVADISAVEFMDSSVINVLMRAQREAEGAGRRFHVQVGTAAIVQRALDITEATTYLNCFATRDEALGVER